MAGIGIVIGIIGVLVAIGAWAWSATRPQRVIVTNPPSPPPAPPAPPAPRFITFAEFQQREVALKAQGWIVKNPTRQGAEETYLPEAWQRDEENGHLILIKGMPSHWPVRRRVAGWGLTEDSKRMILAALRNRIRPRTMQFIPAAYKTESHLIVEDPHTQVDGPASEATLDQLRREEVITEVEWGIYRLTDKGQQEAQRLLDEAGASS